MWDVRRTALVWVVAIAVAGVASAADAEGSGRETRRWLVVASEAWRGPDSLDVATLRRIYLGEQTALAGRRIRPLHLPLGSAEREDFSREVLGRSAGALERYWISQALQGGALPPREVKDAEALLRALRSDDRALGYVAPEAIPSGSAAGIRILEIEIPRR